MNPIVFISLVLAMLGTSFTAQAEGRFYNFNDSTFHPLNADTTVVAGKRHLYLKTNGGLSLLRDFSQPDTNFYIRDFDIVRPDLWYTVVGNRYIGDTTVLYRSTDKGSSWQRDTSFYLQPHDEYYNSISQLQAIGQDTICLFMGYYTSGIIYSVNGGQSWTKWFSNQIIHYHGLFRCKDEYYLYSYEGDGFQAHFFRFAKHLLFSSKANGEWVSFNNIHHPPCYQGAVAGCYYAAGQPGATPYEQLKHLADSICQQPVSVQPLHLRDDDWTVYPNPAAQRLFIASGKALPKTATIRIITVLGQIISEHRGTEIIRSGVDIAHLPEGLYWLRIQDGMRSRQRQFVVHR